DSRGGWWDWPVFLQPYLKNRQLLECPSHPSTGSMDSSGTDPFPVSYTMPRTINFTKLATVTKPAEKVFFMCKRESSSIWTRNIQLNRDPPRADFERPQPDPPSSYVGYWHNEGANYGFWDGHVKWYGKFSTTEDMWHPTWD
ncbi:unnamed protein product, partial [marine sediment metagenome]